MVEAAESGAGPVTISYDTDRDTLDVAEFGVAVDGIDPDPWQALSEDLAYLLRAKDGPAIGFQAKNFSTLDPDCIEGVFECPRFDVPVLGLRDASAGEILLAAESFLEGENTLNRDYFGAAVSVSGEEAVSLWRQCLQTGDMLAHYGLGYTLYELGQHRLAYRHLRYYTELVPAQAWAWCWRGKSAEAIAEFAEARDCYRRAVELEEQGGETTDARDLLSALASRRAVLSEQIPETPIRETPFDSADFLHAFEVPRVGSSPVALFLAGGPLAGKSTVLELLADDHESIVPPGAVRVFPSLIREELPEFHEGVAQQRPDAAEVVRDETEHIARELIRRAADEERELIVDGLGASEPGRFRGVLERFHVAGYEVRVLLVDCPVEHALTRNLKRGARMGLVLPPDEVRRLHAEVSRRHQEWSGLDWVRWQPYSNPDRVSQ